MAQLLVGYGPHHAASHTLRWAAGFADRCQLDLVVVHSIERLESKIEEGLWDELAGDRQRQISHLLAETTDRPFAVEILDGEPHAALIQRAESGDVAYVVAGQHRAGGMGGFGGIGTALDVMHHCDKPVIVVGPGPEVTTGPILVGVDGSDANRPAVAVAEDLASQLGVGAIGLFCTDPMADTFPHPPGWTYPHEDEVRQELSPSLGSGAELVIEHGHPAELIVRTASGRGAQLIVVGIRGRGGFHGLRVGRVPVQVIEHSPVPVVVVPHRA